jgi:hypothetical protein
MITLPCHDCGHGQVVECNTTEINMF